MKTPSEVDNRQWVRGSETNPLDFTLPLRPAFLNPRPGHSVGTGPDGDSPYPASYHEHQKLLSGKTSDNQNKTLRL